jgi:hypothetical protein
VPPPTPDDGWETPIPHRTAAKLELVPDDSVDAGSAPPDSDENGEFESSEAAVSTGYEPPRSRSVSVPARRPQPRHSSEEMRLPSVIVDVEEDIRELLQLVVAGDVEAGDRVVELGEHAVGPLVAIFPGPITRELRRGTGEAPRASDCGPVLRALARIGPAAVPFLLVRTADADAKVRAWATRVLGEIPTLESARAVVRRFTDSDPDVRRAALAAGRLLQADSEARTAIRDGLCDLAAAPAQTKEIRHFAIEALADLRDARAVSRLIRLLEDRSSEILRSAGWALAVLARQDYGRDLSRWSDWWQRNGNRHRIEWLIDALMHDDANIRREAGDELKAITKEYFGYYDDLPKKERQKAQERYRDWWETKGKARFC